MAFILHENQTLSRETTRGEVSQQARPPSAGDERYRTLLDAIDEGFCILEMQFDGDQPLDYRFLEVNSAFERQTGLVAPLGRTARELAPSLDRFWFETYGRVAKTGIPTRFEAPAAALGRHFDVYAFRVDDPALFRVAVLFTDITARKRAEVQLQAAQERQSFLLRLSDALRPILNPVEVQQVATEILGKHLKAIRVFYFEVDAQGDGVTVHRDYVDGVPSVAGRHRISDYDSNAWHCWLAGRVASSDDVTADNLTSRQQTAQASLQVRAWLGVPLVKAGRLLAVLGVQYDRPHVWSEDEISLISDVAERTWSAVERAKAESDLRESVAFHEVVATLGSDWWFVARVEPDGEVVTETLSEGFTRHLGYTAEELMAAGGWAAVMHPEDLPEAQRQMARLLAGETIEGELRHLARDGRMLWYQYRTRPFLDSAGRVVRLFGASRDISDRKKAEDAVRESEERFRALAEMIPSIVWSSDDITVDYFNSRWFAYTGRSADKLNDDSWLAVIHPEDQPLAQSRVQHALQTGAEYEIEYRLRRADGMYRWHIARAIRNPSLNRWFGIATDVHDLREAMDLLRERDEQLALAQRAARLGVSSLDLSTGVGATTPEWREVIGMPEPPAPQDFGTFLSLVHSDDRVRVAGLHVDPPDHLEFEFRVNHPRLGERWLLSRSLRLKAESGPGRLVGLVLDLTDRKRSEEALRRSERLLRAVADQLPGAAIFVVNRELRYTLAEGQAVRDAGFTPADFEGRSLQEVLPRILAEEYTVHYRAALAGSASFIEHTAYDRHYATHIVPLREDSGEVAAVLAVSYDLTERRRMEEELHQAHADLERRVEERTSQLLQVQRLAAVGQAMAGLAHESRNALQRGQACLSILELRLAGQKDLVDLVSRVQRAQDDLHWLYEQAQTYAAPMVLEWGECDLRQITRSAWEDLSVARAGRPILLREEGEASGLIQGSRSHLRQLLRNLLDNALSATVEVATSRDTPAEIVVSFDDQGDESRMLRVEVRDSGPGFTPGQARDVFEPFFTTKIRGTGLGLAICARIVQAHGGSIVAQEGGPGGRVHFALPRRKP